MRDDLCSIPVSEVFEPKDGCPICRMRDTLEQRLTEYITGAAMMEPDIRIETNRLGFCAPHFRQMLKKHNRLPVALILESHLPEAEKAAKEIPKAAPSLWKKSRGEQPKQTCFVCREIDRSMVHLLQTVFRLYAKEADFRALFAAQPVFCRPHYELLLRSGKASLSKKDYETFSADCRAVVTAYLDPLKADVSHFCKMYDYRSVGLDWGTSRNAVERAVWWLTGETLKTEEK